MRTNEGCRDTVSTKRVPFHRAGQHLEVSVLRCSSSTQGAAGAVSLRLTSDSSAVCLQPPHGYIGHKS